MGHTPKDEAGLRGVRAPAELVRPTDKAKVWAMGFLRDCARLVIGLPYTAPDARMLHLIDGVCCESVCLGLWERCALRGTDGDRIAIPAGTTPDGGCAATAAFKG
jgi:hypothetical protein